MRAIVVYSSSGSQTMGDPAAGTRHTADAGGVKYKANVCLLWTINSLVTYPRAFYDPELDISLNGWMKAKNCGCGQASKREQAKQHNYSAMVESE